MAKRTSHDWRRFEEEVCALVGAFGYKAETTQASHDYGVDVVATHSQRKVVVQCKLYGTGRVGGDAIMQLLGSRKFFDATDAVCITTAYFTKQAKRIAEKENLWLVDGERLLALCRERQLTIPSLTWLQASGNLVSTQRPVVSLGRDPENTVVIQDLRVSRSHAVLKRDGLFLTVADLGSSNGTFLNGTRVTAPASVSYQDQLRIGDLTFEVVLRRWK